MDQKDGDIIRNRPARFLVAVASIGVALVLSVYAGLVVAKAFFLWPVLGWSMGLGLSVLALAWVIPRLYVTNGAIYAFVTVNLLSKELVSYGPGFHFAFPWEARDGGNNVSLKEVEGTFDFEVQTKTGTLKGKGSFRLRPDITRLPSFIAGAGTIAAELSDLVSAECVKYLGPKELMAALLEVGRLNEECLKKHFTHGAFAITPFEQRFGVMVGDVTVSKLMPSTEVQKALDGRAEQEALGHMIARNLGYSSMEEVHDAVKTGKLKAEQINTAQENAMGQTDNLGGIKIERHSHTIHLRADDNTAAAIGAAGPALGAGLAGILTKPKSGSKK